MSGRAIAATALLAMLAHPTQAGTINLVKNGDFSAYTTTQTSRGFQVDWSGNTLDNWSNTSTKTWYNFLFRSDLSTGTANSNGGQGVSGLIRMYDRTNCGNATQCSGNTWDGNGPSKPGGGNYNFLVMDGNYPGNTGPVTQTLTGLTAGSNYAVSFTYAFAQQSGFGGATNQNLIVGFGSKSQRVLTSNYTLPDHGFSGWRQATLYFSAASASQALSFLAFGVETLPPFALLANVQVLDVPEPTTLALVGTGIAATLAAARRRRALAKVSAAE